MSLPPEICAQSDHPGLNNADFDRYLLITSQPYKRQRKMFSYSEQEVDHALSNELWIKMLMLPLTPPKGGSKSELVVFVNKIQV